MSPTQILSRYYDNISLFRLEDTQALKSKKTELRLYCDLLMQEIHKVKTIGNRENDTSTTSSNGDDELDETMVKATCDTFIQTLDELMELADQQYHIYGNHRDRVSKVETNHEKKMKQDRTPRPNFIVFKFQMQNLNSWIQTSPKTKLKLGILGSFTLIFEYEYKVRIGWYANSIGFKV